jgi:uncharacterized membrane protein (UPF0127 family)
VRSTWSIGSLILVVLLGWGCGQQPGNGGEAHASPRPAATRWEPTEAQAKLPTEELFIGRHQIRAELARTVRQIQTGMMFRTSIGEDEGMLFVFARPYRASFWMKNVTVPLSVAYIDSEGRILEIHPLEPGVEEPVEAASDRVQFVLETARGWFERHEVEVGTVVRTGRGTLRETFVGR